jgi:hypothetical protein
LQPDSEVGRAARPRKKEDVMMLLDKPFGFAGERKACALVCLAFYTAFFSLLSLLLYNAPPDQPEIRAWWACFAALGATYFVSFFALGAGWFWARWFAMGLGYSGVTLAGWGIITQRTIDPVMAFYGLTHGVILLFLQGQRLAEEFDAKPEWRQALGLDEKAVVRVRQSVTRAATSIPTLIFIALAPREGAEGLIAASLAVVGILGLLQLRTFGVLALLGAGLLLPFAAFLHPTYGTSALGPFGSPHLMQGLSILTAALLVSAAAPFLRPIARFIAGRAS